jgi:hypothetical protein
MDVGLRMLGKRKLNLRPSRVKEIGEMAGLFTGVKEGGEND